MNLEHLKSMVELMNENDLVELEVEEEGKRIRLKKAAPPELTAPVAVPMAAAPAAPAAAPAPAAPAGPEAAAPATDDGLVTIRSPMVGTFYSSPSPDADSYVDVGQSVGADTVVCIIEAMKVMNEIKAEAAGEIVKVCAKNGEAVEYDQPLFILRP